MAEQRVLCTDWPPPSDVSELPAAAFLISTLWKPGQTITIDFIDSRVDAWKMAWVKKVVADYVQPYVNLRLLFGNYGNSADIRITFAHANQAYSRLGTQSTWYKGSREQPESMNLGWLDEPRGSFQWEGVTYTPPACTWCSSNTNGSVIIHEFGHALGMVHEHQNPQGGIQWDVPAVLNYFRGAPNYWSDEAIYFNVLDKYASNLLNASQFDPKSVMLYAFPASLTLDGYATKANPSMSATDIEWMGKVYGGVKKEDTGGGGVETKTKTKTKTVDPLAIGEGNGEEVDEEFPLPLPKRTLSVPLIWSTSVTMFVAATLVAISLAMPPTRNRRRYY